MNLNYLVEQLKKIDLMAIEEGERGQGLEPLLDEFVEDFPSLPDEAKITRTRQISDYYNEIYNRSHGNVQRAYAATRRWAMKVYVQHWAKKMDKKYLRKDESINETGKIFKPATAEQQASRKPSTPNGDPVKLAIDLQRAGFTDGIDIDPEISLLEYGILRNPHTSKVIACLNVDDRAYPPRFDTDTISFEDIIEVLNDMPGKFFKMTGISKDTYMADLNKNHLALTISDINGYNGHFSESYYYMFTANAIRRIILAEPVNEAESQYTEEMIKHYHDRTNQHIGRVQNAAKKIAEQDFPEFSSEELLKNVKIHDQSKFEEPEYTPYISLTWRHKLNKDKGQFDSFKDKDYQPPGLLHKKDENEATLYHVRNPKNKHHPEAWKPGEANIDPNDRNKSMKCIDVSNMEPVFIAEMVADWQAMSEELGTNTARQWFEKCKDVRWHFSNEQIALIDKLLGVFEK